MIPVSWRSRIEAYDPPHSFVDVQLRGPYRRWDHRHTFRAVDGGTQVIDEVEYELPFGPLGDLVHRLVVRNQLRHIFDYRAAVLATALRAPEAHPTGRSIAVAGGTGFVGGAIASELHRRGHRVVVLSHRGEAARGSLADAIEIRSADVSDPGRSRRRSRTSTRSSSRSRSRIHRWSRPERATPSKRSTRRGRSTSFVRRSATGVRRLVYISGAGAAPDAERHWFRAKWRAEQSVRGSGIAYTIIRPTWIYGPRDVSLNRFMAFARFLPVRPADQHRPTTTSRRCSSTTSRISRLTPSTTTAPSIRTFELGGPETLTMREIIARSLRIAGLRRPILPGPTPLLKLAAAPLSLLPSPPLTPAAIDFINEPAIVDVTPLLARMPRRLTRLDDALRTYLRPGPEMERSLEIDGKSTA